MCSDHYYPTAAAPRRREEGDSSLSGSFKLGLHIFDIDAAMSTQLQNWCLNIGIETANHEYLRNADKCPNFIRRQLVKIVCSTIRRLWCKLRTFYHSVDVNIGELYLNS